MTSERDVVDVGAALAQSFTRLGSVGDQAFDQIYEDRWRRASSCYWTPVAVAMRASAWFEEHGGRRVLDIGSGAGKACIVGALCSRLTFVGIEQREELVSVAQRAAVALGVADRASFVRGTIASFDTSPFDCIYLFNPFAENLFFEDLWLDDTVELSESRFRSDVRTVEQILDASPTGTKLVTYHGFGGRIPDGFAPMRSAAMGDDWLRLWEKQTRRRTGYYVETGDAFEHFHDPDDGPEADVPGRLR